VCHTVTQGSTIPQQAVSVLLKGVPRVLKSSTNVSAFVRNHEMCRFWCGVSDLQDVSLCRPSYILIYLGRGNVQKFASRTEKFYGRKNRELE
jgi:hypothetical protein